MKLITVILLVCLQHMARAQEVVQAEYFVDADMGYGRNTLVDLADAADGSFPFTVDLSAVAPGFHRLYFRTKSTDGNWSLTSNRLIQVLASQDINHIVAGEYFFDADPGYGNAIPIVLSPEGVEIAQFFSANANSLSMGYHKLYGRLQDTYGRWSHSFRRTIEVSKVGDNAVQQVEYFFKNDAGVGNCTSSVFAVPLPDGSFTFTIPLNEITTDADTLFMRVLDSANANWSLTSYNIDPLYLPLTLVNFSGGAAGNIVALTWQTTNEVNTSYFLVERSVDSRSFTDFAMVKATGNASLNNYTANDEPGITGKIYYRLKQVDVDGRFSYSNVVAVILNGNSANFSIYPNPARNHFTLLSNLSSVGGSTVTIADATGKLVKREKLVSNRQTINVSLLAKGVYVVTVQSLQGSSTMKLLVE